MEHEQKQDHDGNIPVKTDSDKQKSRSKHRKRNKEKGSKQDHDEGGIRSKRKSSRRHDDKENKPLKPDKENSSEKQRNEKVNRHKSSGMRSQSSAVSDEDGSEYEFKRKVSWKANIESSKEFQSSVMEQNVFVSLDDPDEEFHAKKSREERYHRKEKGGYIWDEKSLGENINFLTERPHVVERAVAKQSTDGARGFKGFTTGRHTFRFKFNDKPWGSNCSIGICTKNAKMHGAGYHHLFGCDKHSWVWDIPSGCLLHGGNSKQHYVTAIEEKSIYMTLDMNKGTLYFQPKGRDRFMAFKGLKDLTEELYPCVSLVYGLSEAKISLKSTSFDDKSSSVEGKEESKDEFADKSNEPTTEITDVDQLQVVLSNGNDQREKQINNGDSSDKDAHNIFNNYGDRQNEGKKIESDSNFTSEKDQDNQSEQTGDESLSDGGNNTEKHQKNLKDKQSNTQPTSTAILSSVSKHKTDESSQEKSDEQSDNLNDTQNMKEDFGGDDELEQPGESGNDSDNDGRKSAVDREALYKKPSTLSWMNGNGWGTNDLYIVENGSIIKETVNEKEMSGEEEADQVSWDGFIPCAPIYKSPAKTVMSGLNRLSTDGRGLYFDEEEPEDAKYTHVSSLENYEEYGLQMLHGWDVSNKGGGIQLYPCVPYICVPLPNFGDKTQGVRGRKAFKSGIHKWSIKELKLFSPKVSLDEMHDTCNKLLVGVASDEQRTFNFGYQLQNIGRDAWLYEIDTGLIWHGNEKKLNFTHSAASNDSDSEPLLLDMTRGIEIMLNFYKHRLTISYDGKVLTEIRNIQGKVLYPFVLFNKQGPFPVEIKYLEGPDDYIVECLDLLDKMKHNEKEELDTYRGLHRQLSSKSAMVVIQDDLIKVYDWGEATKGLKLSGGGSLKFSSKGTGTGRHFMAIAEVPVTGQKHKIDFMTNHLQHFVFGLVSETFDRSEIQCEGGIRNTETVSLLGSNIHSWAWDPKTLSLYHGGRFLGKYPSGAIDFELEKYDCLRLVIDFGANGYNIASFTAINTERNDALDLGIAFVNLPKSVYPSVALVAGWEDEKVLLNMNYVAGPKGFVTNIVQSKSCTIL